VRLKANIYAQYKALVLKSAGKLENVVGQRITHAILPAISHTASRQATDVILKENNDITDRLIDVVHSDAPLFVTTLIANLKKDSGTNTRNNKHIVIPGRSGTGKKLLTLKIAKETNRSLHVIDFADVLYKHGSNSVDYLNKKISKIIKKNTSCVVVLDKINDLIRSNSELLSNIIKQCDKSNKVFLILISNTESGLSTEQLVRKENIVLVGSPNISKRLEILKLFLEGKTIETTLLEQAIKRTNGRSITDLKALVDRINLCHSAQEDNMNIVTADVFEQSVKDLFESGDSELDRRIKTLSLELAPQEIKNIINDHHENLNRSKEHQEIIILYGPQDSGKSTLASAISDKLGWSIKFIKIQELLTSYQNCLAENLRKRIAPVIQSGLPTVIVLDEVNSITDGSKAGNDTEGISQEEATRQLWSILDGCKNHNIIFVLTCKSMSNFADPLLDRAGKRNIFKINFPAKEIRKRIIKHYLPECDE